MQRKMQECLVAEMFTSGRRRNERGRSVKKTGKVKTVLLQGQKRVQPKKKKVIRVTQLNCLERYFLN
jgi:ribosomal protein S26